MSNSNQNSSSNGIKWLVAILIFASGIAFAFVRYRSVQAPVANAPERRPERQMAAERPEGERPEPGEWGRGQGRPSEEQRQAFRERMVAELNLTPEQEKQMEEVREQMRDLPRGPEGMEQRVAMMAKILTPEQMEKARTQFRGRIMGRMSRQANVLPPAERAKFEKKLAERQAEMQARMDRVIQDAQQSAGSAAQSDTTR